MGAPSKIDIMVRCYEEDQCTRDTIESIKKTATTNYTLTINPNKASCAANYNLLIKAAKSECIIIVDDDVSFKDKGWDAKLVESLYSDNRIGVVAPRILTKDGGWINPQTDAEKNKLTIGTKVAGIVLAFKNVGILCDEKYIRSQWEDTDFLYEYMKRGYLVAIDGRVEAYHMRPVTSGYHDYIEKNQKYFLHKWGVNDQRWGNKKVLRDYSPGPIVDILTLAGGGIKTIERLIKSFDKVQGINYRHIIFVQGDQKTWGYLSKIDDHRIYAINNPQNLKISVGYNHLLEASSIMTPKSDYIMFMDDDFELKVDAPKKLLESLLKNKFDVVAMMHSWYLGGVPNPPIVSECGGGTLLFHRKVFDTIGYIDEAYWSQWDSDYCYRMVRCHGMKLGIATDSAAWATHHVQVGTKLHGMDHYNSTRESSMKYCNNKWSVPDISHITKLDPLPRPQYLVGSGFQMVNGVNKTKL